MYHVIHTANCVTVQWSSIVPRATSTITCQRLPTHQFVYERRAGSLASSSTSTRGRTYIPSAHSVR